MDHDTDRDARRGPDLAREFGPFDSTMMMVGIVIGSGIFLTTGLMAESLPSSSLILLAWLVGGLLTLAGALTFAELGVLFPEAGGQYVYLREAYGPMAGFLFGWILFLVSMSGSIAALGAAFAEYFGRFFPALSTSRALIELPLRIPGSDGTWTLTAGQLVAVLLILLFSAINYLGVGLGKRIQNGVTVVKIGSIFLIGVVGIVLARGPIDLAVLPAGSGTGGLVAGFGMALIMVSWGFDGWNNVTYFSGEIRDPERNLPRALIGGTILITLLYLLMNWFYLKAFTPAGMAGIVPIAERATAAVMGEAAASIVTVVVLISMLGALHGAIFAGARVYFAMARDQLFFGSIGEVHPRFGTPAKAILWQGVWAGVLTLSGTFEQLITFVMFVTIGFWIAATASVFTLRKKYPDRPRPYRTLGYPVVPLIFIVASTGIMLNTILERPVESLSGLALAVLGIPIYHHWKSKKEGTMPAEGTDGDE
ncbi:APC family permease [Gemmatimonadota bacterium]